MKSSVMIVCLSAVLLSASQSLAARCGSVATPNHFVFCDDFDRYCANVPVDPQDACDCQIDVPFTAAFEGVWVPLPKLGSGASGAHTLFSYWLAGQDAKWESSKCHSSSYQGYGVRVYQQDSTGVRIRRNERDMTAEILANPVNNNGYGYVNGAGEISIPLDSNNAAATDYVDSTSSSLRPGALKGFFRMKLNGVSHYGSMLNYVELFADNDRAPFNWVSQYCSGEYINNPKLIRTGDGLVHASFAIGLVSLYDSNPCDVDNGRAPTQWRLVIFDGLEWRELRAGSFGIPHTSPADQADFYPADGWNEFSYSIGADFIEVRVQNATSAARYANSLLEPKVTPWIPNPYFVARIPRQYKGPFNKIAIGPNHGLDLTTPTCEYFKIDNQFHQRCNGGENNIVGACTPATVEDDCPVATTALSPKINGGADIMVDEASLRDGVFDGVPSACCKADLTCEILGPEDCAAANGVYQEGVTSCDPSPCCPVPFADSDVDGDVDMADFAALQRCLNIGSNAPATFGEGCACFDTNDNGVIDDDDVVKFAECGTGSGVQWVPTLACPSPLPPSE